MDDGHGSSDPPVAGAWQHPGLCFRVAFEPRIALRGSPDRQAAVVGSAKAGELLEVTEVKDGWARLSEQEQRWRCARPVDAAWALLDGGPGLGRLLEPHDPLGPLLPSLEVSTCTVAAGAESGALGGAPLVCFLASHASSEERVERFAEVLASIAAQEPSVQAEVLVSWSADGAALRQRVRTLLAGAARRLGGLRSIEQPGQRSQFQHLASCLGAALAEESDRRWVLFSDDDDLWHPHRYSEYLEVIRTLGASGGSGEAAASVAAASHAKLRFDEKPRARRAQDVDGLLALGPKVCRVTDALGGADLPEYFDFAVPLLALAEFLQQTPARFLEHRYCDRRFVTWLKSGWGDSRGDALEREATRLPLHWFAPRGWLYFHSRCAEVVEARSGRYDGGASGAVEVQGEDWRAAAAALARAEAAGGAGGRLAEGLDPREAALVAAMLRRAIEEMVVAAGDGPVCSTLAQEELRRFCGFAAREAHEGRLRRWAAHDSDYTAAWALELAEGIGLEVCRDLEVPLLES